MADAPHDHHDHDHHDHEHDHALHAAIQDEAAARLAAGPLTVEELSERLAADGVLAGEAEERHEALLCALEEDCAFVELPDGRIASLAVLLDGVTFGTQLEPEDALEGVLALSPDCDPIAWWMIDHPAVTADGEPVEVLDTVEGPFAAIADGTLPLDGGALAVSFDGTVLRVDPLDAAPAPPLDAAAEAALATAVRAAFDRAAIETSLELPGAEGPAPTWRQLAVSELWWVLLADPEAIPRGVVLPPMRRLLAAAGLREAGPAVVPTELDRALQQRWTMRNRLRGIYGLAGPQLDAAEALIGAMRHADAALDGAPDDAGDAPIALDAAGPAGTTAAELAAALADPAVARVAFAHAREELLAPRSLLALAATIIEGVEEQHAAGARWLAGRALDHAGLPLEAETQFELALARPGPVFAPAAVALAAVAADRGDASRAASLLRQAGVDQEALEDAYDDGDGDDDEEDDGPRSDRPEDLFGYDGGLTLLAEILPWALTRPRPAARRNDPCPCGSGRKYKQCHQGRPEPLPLEERAAWLYAKARRYVADNRFRHELADVADRLVQASGLGHAFLAVVLDSELAADIALYEGGRLIDFVQERRAVLPADEAALAASWQAPARAVFEVERYHAQELHLRDAATRERVVVAGIEPADAPSGLLLGRPLPVGERWRGFAGFVPLPAAWAPEAIDVLEGQDPLEVAALLGRCLGALVEQGEPFG